MKTQDVHKLFLKNTKQFTETTPEGNTIQGRILLNHGYYHGSLLIETVNDEVATQFIRGFPKIHYYDESIHEIPEDINGFQGIIGYEKLDGTCVGFYPLQNHKGQIIEIVPKSRQRAVLDEHFRDMLKYCDTRLIYEYIDLYELNNIFVELYGMLNEHTLPHKKTYIDIRLIGAVDKEYNMVSTHYLKTLSKIFQIPLPQKIVTIKTNYLRNVFKGYSVEYERNIFETIHHDRYNIQTFQEVIQNIKEHLDYCNNIYKNEKGYLHYEGVVLQNNCWNDDDGISTQYIKIKPVSFLEESKCGTPLKVPLNEIRKEIRKIINENLNNYLEEYNEKKVIQQIKEELQEEFDETDIKNTKTQKTIIKELHKYIDSISDKSINSIVDTIIQENSDNLSNISTLMKYFATQYPMRKHQSQDVYYVLSKRLEKLGKKR